MARNNPETYQPYININELRFKISLRRFKILKYKYQLVLFLSTFTWMIFIYFSFILLLKITKLLLIFWNYLLKIWIYTKVERLGKSRQQVWRFERRVLYLFIFALRLLKRLTAIKYSKNYDSSCVLLVFLTILTKNKAWILSIDMWSVFYYLRMEHATANYCLILFH